MKLYFLKKIMQRKLFISYLFIFIIFGGTLIKATSISEADLRRYLMHGTVKERQKAGYEIWGMNNPPKSLLPVLKKTLNDQDPKTRYIILHAIANYGKDAKELIPDLLKHLKTEPRQNKVPTIYALGKISRDSEIAIPEIVKYIISNQGEYLKITAVKALIDIGPLAKPAILKLLQAAPNPGISMTIAYGLYSDQNWMKYPDIKEAVKAATTDSMIYRYEKNNKNVLTNGDFESSGPHVPGWEVLFREGAKGNVGIDNTLSRSGRQSLKITKTNGRGYIEIRSRDVTEIKKDKGISNLRMYFHSDNSPVSSGVLLRFVNRKGRLIADDSGLNRSHGLWSQSQARNASSGKWIRRIIQKRNLKNESLRASIIIHGNPTTVWVDDVQFPAPRRIEYNMSVVEPPMPYTLEEALNIINKRRPVTSKLRMENGKTKFFLNGKAAPLIIYTSLSPTVADYNLFEGSGVKLQMLTIHFTHKYGYKPNRFSLPGIQPVWLEDGSYNASGIEKVLEMFARRAPHSNIILTFYISWPNDYIAQNPEEAWLDAKGEFVGGTSMHIRSKKQMKNLGKSNWSGGKDFIPWPSMYSDKAMKDAGKMIKKVIATIKKTPYAKMIAGTCFMGGHDGQFFINRADYSENGKKAWRAFLRKKYGTDSALAQAWHKSAISIDNVKVPVLTTSKKTQTFSSPDKDIECIDYREMMSLREWQIKDYFSKIIKQEFDRSIVAISWVMGANWREMDGFLNARYLDVCVGQPSYQDRLPGYSGGLDLAYESLSLNTKMGISELDLRTWYRGIYPTEPRTMRIGTAESAADFSNILRKEVAPLLAKGEGWWFFDIGSGAFRNPAIQKNIKKTTEIAQKVISLENNFTPDLAVIMNEASYKFSSLASLPLYGLKTWSKELKTSGVPYDTYFFNDLKKHPSICRKYKIFLFITPYFISEADHRFINHHLKKDGHIIIWHYAPGFITPHGCSTKFMYSVTGIQCATNPSPVRQEAFVCGNDPLSKGLRPLAGSEPSIRMIRNSNMFNVRRFWISDSQVVPLAAYADGKTAIAKKRFKEWTSIYCAPVLGIGGDLLNNVAHDAGAYVICKPGPEIRMNGVFISIQGIVNGKRTFQLPRKAEKVTDAFTGKIIAENTAIFTLDLKADETIWLLYE